MEKLKAIGKVFYWLVLAFLIFVAGFTAMSALNLPGNYKLFVVMSGSMKPTIKTGSVVVVKPEKTYAKGDIITFQDPTKSKTTITHRIFEASGSAFLTKGDANKDPDPRPVQFSQVKSRYLFKIPYVGYLTSFVRTRLGWFLAIILPAIALVGFIVKDIIKEALKNETASKYT